ncbi:MAG: hypothetical protein DYG94_02910 [Leptolyngbya sp. PLA3]|nr:MAG: hypothetical protein EDM82_11390 [Cyanobacteria bacterium CYA]MCE7967679.1 hypothetical protein [Leptolyngbya sp. PL-A3]
MSESHETPARPLLAPIDPGWLFLLAGLTLLAAAVLIPAQQDLADARWRRDAALAHEQNRLERLGRYEEYLAAIERNDRALVESLAASQLGLVPKGGAPVDSSAHPNMLDASIFRQLEPGAVTVASPPTSDSILSRLVSSRKTRLWVIAGAAVCVLIGTLPHAAAARRRARDAA